MKTCPTSASRRRRPRVGLSAGVAVLSLLLLAFFPGCQAGYLRRQAMGLLRILCGRVEIDDALLARVSPAEGAKLIWVARVREFAGRELGLEPGDAYTAYYDTRGKPASTIVVAAHPLALVPYRWRFPLAGRVPYKGHFDPAEALRERDRLRRLGWDAEALPVRAFSSLGWFSDPVLSGMLGLPEEELADLIIHELTHRAVYFRGHSELNESLAEVVARGGTERLLAKTFGEESEKLRLYRGRTAREDLHDAVLERLWADLDALFRSRLPDPAKLTRKSELFAAATLALKLAGAGGRIEPSNAALVLDRQYRGLVPLLREAQAALGGHPRDLVAALKPLQGSSDPLAALAERVAAARSSPAAAGAGPGPGSKR